MAKNLAGSMWLKNIACKDSPPKLFSTFDPEKIEEAKSICAICTERLRCLMSSWESAVITAETTKYERLLAMWRRVEDRDDSNWSGPDILFKNEGKRKR